MLDGGGVVVSSLDKIEKGYGEKWELNSEHRGRNMFVKSGMMPH